MRHDVIRCAHLSAAFLALCLEAAVCLSAPMQVHRESGSRGHTGVGGTSPVMLAVWMPPEKQYTPAKEHKDPFWRPVGWIGTKGWSALIG